MAVAVAVVIAQQVLSARLLASSNRQRLVDRGEQVLCQVWREGDDGVEVRGCVLRVQPSEEVPWLVG
jgi:hypothetical protein